MPLKHTNIALFLLSGCNIIFTLYTARMDETHQTQKLIYKK